MSQLRKPKWPYKDFRAYIQERMIVKGIRTRAELARAAELNEAQLSNWWAGKNQPTKESLRKLASPLGVHVLALELKAGLTEPDEVEVNPDERMWPQQVELALDAFLRAQDDRPDLVDGLLERFRDLAGWYEWQSKQSRRT